MPSERSGTNVNGWGAVLAALLPGSANDGLRRELMSWIESGDLPGEFVRLLGITLSTIDANRLHELGQITTRMRAELAKFGIDLQPK